MHVLLLQLLDCFLEATEDERLPIALFVEVVDHLYLLNTRVRPTWARQPMLRDFYCSLSFKVNKNSDSFHPFYPYSNPASEKVSICS